MTRSRHALAAEPLGQVVQRAQVDALGEQRKVVRRAVERLELPALPLLQRDPGRVLRGLDQQRVDRVRADADARRLETRRDEPAVQLALRGGGQLRLLELRARAPR